MLVQVSLRRDTSKGYAYPKKTDTILARGTRYTSYPKKIQRSDPSSCIFLRYGVLYTTPYFRPQKDTTYSLLLEQVSLRKDTYPFFVQHFSFLIKKKKRKGIRIVSLFSGYKGYFVSFWGTGYKVQGLVYRIQGIGYRVLGYRVLGYRGQGTGVSFFVVRIFLGYKIEKVKKGYSLPQITPKGTGVMVLLRKNRE